MTYIKRQLFPIVRVIYSSHGLILCIRTSCCNRTWVGTNEIVHCNLILSEINKIAEPKEAFSRDSCVVFVTVCTFLFSWEGVSYLLLP